MKTSDGIDLAGGFLEYNLSDYGMVRKLCVRMSYFCSKNPDSDSLTSFGLKKSNRLSSHTDLVLSGGPG